MEKWGEILESTLKLKHNYYYYYDGHTKLYERDYYYIMIYLLGTTRHDKGSQRDQ